MFSADLEIFQPVIMAQKRKIDLEVELEGFKARLAAILMGWAIEQIPINLELQQEYSSVADRGKEASKSYQTVTK